MKSISWFTNHEEFCKSQTALYIFYFLFLSSQCRALTALDSEGLQLIQGETAATNHIGFPLRYGVQSSCLSPLSHLSKSQLFIYPKIPEMLDLLSVGYEAYIYSLSLPVCYRIGRDLRNADRLFVCLSGVFSVCLSVCL